MTSTTPQARPARFPAEYGQDAETLAVLQRWEDVTATVAASPNYWLATTTDDGRPHVRPVDGVFVESTLAFGGSPETRWVRHLQARPEASVSLPDDDHAVILEGRVELITDETAPIVAVVSAANRAKYPQYFGDDSPHGPVPFWALRPQRVYAWSLSEFPRRATRFDLVDTR
jgi:general stress protein 26